MSRVPEGYVRTEADGAHLCARADVVEFAREAVASAGSLANYAAVHPDRQPLAGGRGATFAVPTPHGTWVVRRSRRGGWMRVWGDRYLRWGRPRVLRELEASVQARARGVPTPEVVVAAWYPRTFTYRAEIATLHIPDACDLATLLFGPEPLEADDRVLAWAAAGRLLRWLYTLGVVHPDLNLTNVLLECATRPPRPYLLDLDRARVVDRVSARQRRAMVARFRRSAEKRAARAGRPITPDEWRAFRAAYRTVHG